MDLENQKRVKEFAEEYGAENLVVVLGAAEGEAAGLAAETVTVRRSYFCRSIDRSPAWTHGYITYVSQKIKEGI